MLGIEILFPHKRHKSIGKPFGVSDESFFYDSAFECLCSVCMKSKLSAGL